MTDKKKITIKLPTGEIIRRVPTFKQLGNFVMVIVRYKNKRYLVGDGDEYLRDGYEQVFELGRKLEWWQKEDK